MKDTLKAIFVTTALIMPVPVLAQEARASAFSATFHSNSEHGQGSINFSGQNIAIPMGNLASMSMSGASGKSAIASATANRTGATSAISSASSLDTPALSATIRPVAGGDAYSSHVWFDNE